MLTCEHTPKIFCFVRISVSPFDELGHYISMGSAFIREVYYREEKERMSVAIWLKCLGPRLRTPGIDCASSKRQKTQNLCSKVMIFLFANY